MATGLIISTTTLTQFLGAINLAIESQQDNNATTPNDTNVQNAINVAEARCIGKLAVVRCKSGTFFKIPFAINGVPLLSVSGSISLPILQQICHQYAAFTLEKWHMLTTVSEDVSQGVISSIAMAFEKDADDKIDEIIRWTEGYTDGAQYIDLDLNAGAVPGQDFRQVSAPKFGRQWRNPDGTPITPILGPMSWANWYCYGGRYPWCGISE